MLERTLTTYSTMISARTRYLHGCIEKNLKPRAGLLLRKVRDRVWARGLSGEG